MYCTAIFYLSMYGTGMETAIFYPEAERDKAFVIKCA